MNKISIVLNKQIQCEQICNEIQKLVTKLQQGGQDLSGSVLVIDVINVTDGGDSHIPKLTYSPDSLT